MTQAVAHSTEIPPSLQLLRSDLLRCLATADRSLTNPARAANGADWWRLNRAARKLGVRPRVYLQHGQIEVALDPVEPSRGRCWFCGMLGGVHEENCKAA